MTCLSEELDNGEAVSTTGQAAFVQEDGTKILGNANFYWGPMPLVSYYGSPFSRICRASDSSAISSASYQIFDSE